MMRLPKMKNTKAFMDRFAWIFQMSSTRAAMMAKSVTMLPIEKYVQNAGCDKVSFSVNVE